jgi:hypothetical protein
MTCVWLNWLLKRQNQAKPNQPKGKQGAQEQKRGRDERFTEQEEADKAHEASN